MQLRGALTSERLRDVFQKLAKNKAIGTLTVTEGQNKKFIYFARAGVRLLSSGKQRRMKLGDLLVAKGKLSADQLQAILQRQEETGEMIGKILSDWGLVTEEEIDDAVREQIEEEIYDLFTLENAAFEFSEGAPPQELFDPDQRATRLTFDVDKLVAEASRRAAELGELRDLVPSDRVVFEKAAAGALSFSEHEDAAATKIVVDLVDGARPVAAICDASGLSRFDTFRALAGLVVAGRIREAGSEGAGRSGDGAEAGDGAAGGDAPDLRATVAECESQLLAKPNDLSTRLKLAEAYTALDERDNALLHWNLAAKAALKAGDLEQAEHATRQGLAQSPDDRDANERLLRVFVESRRGDEALAQSEKLAAQYQEAGEREKLRDMYRLLTHLLPDDGDLRKRLVNVYLDLNDTEGALGEYEAMAKIAAAAKDQRTLEEIYVKAIRLAPGRPDIQRRFRSLGLGGPVKLRRRGRGRVLLFRAGLFGAVALAGGFALRHELTARAGGQSLWVQALAAEEAARQAESKNQAEAAKALFRQAREQLAAIRTRHPWSLFTWLEVTPRLTRVEEATSRFEFEDAAAREGEKQRVRAEAQQAETYARQGRKDLASPLYQRLAARDAKLFPDEVGKAQAFLAEIANRETEAEALLAKVKAAGDARQITEARARLRELLSPDFQGTRAWGEARWPLLFQTAPSGAEVFRGGARVGQSPYLVWLTPEEHASDPLHPLEFEVRLDGYESRTVKFFAGETTDPTQEGVYTAELAKRPLFVIALGGETGTGGQVESLCLHRGWLYGGTRANDGEVFGVRLADVDPARPETWQPTWRFDVPGIVSSAVVAPVVCDDDGIVYAASLSGVLYALRGETSNSRGEMLWSYPENAAEGPGNIHGAPVLLPDGVGFCAYRANRGQFTLLARHSPAAPQVIRKLEIGASEVAPVAVDDLLVFATRGVAAADPRGRLRVYHWGRGQIVAETWFPAEVRGAPCIEGDVCIVGDRDGRLHLLDFARSADEPVPSLKPLDQAELGDAVARGPVLRDRSVYAATKKGNVFAWKIRDRKFAPAWKSDVRWTVEVGPALSENTLYCGTVGDEQGGTLAAVNLFTGAREWEYRTKRAVNCLPVVADGRVYFGADDGRVYALAER